MPRAHHLNCGTLRPLAGPLLDRGMQQMVCHCLVVETDRHGLALVDTGLGRRDIEEPERRLGRSFLWTIRPALDPAEPAVAQLPRLGFEPRDVRHIVLTHLDVDHAGGLSDFPDAVVHVLEPELQAARAPTTPLEHQRYRPAHLYDTPIQWRASPGGGGEPWHGLTGARQLEGLPPDVLLVPLPGHTRGHAGVAVSTATGWLLHAGDAYILDKELDSSSVPSPGQRLYHGMFDLDGRQRERTLGALQRLRAADEIEVFSTHDASEMPRARGRVAP